MSDSERWQAQLLAGVDMIPQTGAVPATLTIQNPQARSIAPGPNNEVWIAATQVQSGRVLVVGHEGYLTDFTTTHKNEHIAQLHFNFKLWLTSGRFKNNRDIAVLGQTNLSRSGLSNNKILIWNGADDLHGITSQDIIQYVTNGGGLIHCACAWGWLQLRPDKTLNDMPLKRVLDFIGIYYNNAPVFIPENGLLVSHLVPPNFQYRKIQQDEHQSFYRAPTNDDVAQHWRHEILHGVTKIPHTGAVPGSLVIFGESARAIMSGSKMVDVWIGAAELGNGRVIVVAHEGYLSDFNRIHSDKNIRILHNNFKKWLTKGRDTPSNIIYANSPRQPLIPKNGTILVWSGQHQVSFTTEEVINFIISGGGFVHTMCPWGWLMCHRGQTFDDMPYDGVLDTIGISYTQHYNEFPPDGLDVISCYSSDECHLGRAVDEVTRSTKALSHFADSLALISELTDKKLETMSGKIEYLAKILETTDIDIVPSNACPVRSAEGKALMGVCETLSKAGKLKSALPGIANFPGDFDSTPPKNTRTIEVTSYREDVHPTGCYVKAGDIITVTVLSKEALNKEWLLRIGAHTDCLSGQSELKRWPNVVCSTTLNQQRTSLKSDFGGLVYLLSPDSQNTIRVQLENVIDAPYFDLHPTSVECWSSRRHAPGLWADICGEFLIITLPSEKIRNQDDPTMVMKKWDEVLKSHFHLKGVDIRNHRKQWLVTDVQPSAGYMHSGYPVVTHLDVADPSHEFYLLNHYVLSTKGSWGVFHEFGHNMQEAVWTFPGTTEVTVNIFTLHAMDVLTGQKPLIHEWLQNQIPNARRYLNESDKNYSDWKSDPGVALFIYAQIAHHIGWGIYRAVFREYERMDRNTYPNQENDQIDLWYLLLSEKSGNNLAPLVDFWKIPLSQSVRKRMSKLQAYLPRDEVINFSASRERFVLQKYPSCMRKPVSRLV